MRVLHVKSSYVLTLLPYSIKAYVGERSSGHQRVSCKIHNEKSKPRRKRQTKKEGESVHNVRLRAYVCVHILFLRYEIRTERWNDIAFECSRLR